MAPLASALLTMDSGVEKRCALPLLAVVQPISYHCAPAGAFTSLAVNLSVLPSGRVTSMSVMVATLRVREVPDAHPVVLVDALPLPVA